jgi:hypothetical protein
MKTMEEKRVEGCSITYNTFEGGGKGMLELQDGD